VTRDQDLASALRAELAAVEPARSCCRTAERAGLGQAASGRARTPWVARLAVRLEEGPDASAAGFDWRTAPEHCRLAYLRGRFLAQGSLSISPGRTHLEFVVPAQDAPVLAAQLGEIGLPAGWRIRRGRGVVTWKGADPVLTFLRRAGGTASVLELEARLVTRALRGHLNRVINAETANLERSVVTASRQLAAIEALEASGRMAALPQTARALARLRREAPEQTFSELAARLGVSRSVVQRSFEQLETAALRAEPAMRQR
jgi:DNA-binding protein WhiA